MAETVIEKASTAQVPPQVDDDCDIPELDSGFWDEAELRFPNKKEHITIRLDSWIVEYFKRGPGGSPAGYQSRINDTLRSYVLHHLSKEAEEKAK